MEDKKTIKQLNNKAWYRAIKVIYLFLFLVVFVSIIVIFSFGDNEFKILDISNSKVICQYGNKKQFLMKDIFSKKEISTIRPKYLDGKGGRLSRKMFTETILKSCEINKIRTAKDTDIKDFSFADKIRIIPYKIEKQYKTQYGYLFLSLFILIFIFEIIRRIFYYIVLGTIKPKHTN